MTARPVFLKLAAFFFAFAAAVAIVSVLRHGRGRPSNTTDCALTSRRPATPEFVLAENLETEVEMISLDRERAQSYTRLKLRHVGASLPPERLWVRTYFFSADDKVGRYWADDSVEVLRPLAAGGTASVTVAAPCTWCDDDGVPRSGYFARVQIFDGRDETPLPWGAEAGDIRTAVPVVVHAERPPILRP